MALTAPRQNPMISVGCAALAHCYANPSFYDAENLPSTKAAFFPLFFNSDLSLEVCQYGCGQSAANQTVNGKVTSTFAKNYIQED